MSTHQEREAAYIAKAIEARGIRGVHVDVDDEHVTYLDGQVKNNDEEATAVEVAYELGASEVVDGLTYPGQHVVTHHVAAITSGIPVNHHKDKPESAH